MSTENTNVAVVETVETPKAKTPRKSPAKKPVVAKTPSAPKAEKAEPAAQVGVAKKTGLRKAQERILLCLAKLDKSLTRGELSKKAPVDVAACVEYLGSHNPEKRAENDVKHFPSLLTLGFVKLEKHDENGKDVIRYAISAKGKKAAEKIGK